MSRPGKKPVAIDSKVTVDYKDRLLKIKGPKGQLELKTPESVELDISKEEIKVVADFETKEGKTIGGTIRQLINNIIIGVTEGFEKKLDLVGVGYRAQVSGTKLVLNLGYSHPIEYEVPDMVTAAVENNTKVVLTSCDKQKVGQAAAEIRSFRPPEPYKGKGVKYEDEYIRRKAGKTGKK